MEAKTIKIAIDTIEYYKNKKTAKELEEVPIDILRCMYLDLLNNVEQLEKENKEFKKYKERCNGAVEFINSRIDGIVEDCYEDLHYILCESEEGEW